MSAESDRYGGAAPGTNHIVTNNFLVSIGVMVGWLGIAVMAMSLQVKAEPFYDFANYSLQILDQTAFVVYVGMGALGVGCLTILTGMLIALSGIYVSYYPNLVYLALVLSLVSAGGSLAGGALVQNGVGLLNSAIYNQNSATQAPTGSADSTDASLTTNAVHYQLVMFNECCASQGFGHTKEFYDDPNIDANDDLNGYVKWCETLADENIEDMQDITRPRTCYENPDVYRKYNDTVFNNKDRICSTLETVTVNIAGKTIPGTSIQVSSQTDNNEIIKLVAGFAAPNYGCGLGYALAFQAAMLVWVENVIAPVGSVLIGSGAIQVVLLLFAAAGYYSCSVGGGETSEEKYARYMEELANSTGHQPAAPAHYSNKVQDESFEQSNPSARMSSNIQNAQVVNAQHMSVQRPMSQGNPAFVRNSVQSAISQGSNSRQGNTGEELGFNVDDKI